MVFIQWLRQYRVGINKYLNIGQQRQDQINSMSIHPQKNHSKQNIRSYYRKNDRESEEMSFGTRGRKERVSSPSIFISKTFEILENQEYQQIIRWNPDGLTFIIDDVEKFEQEVLPVFFRHRNFSSFVRQLNMYDFHKIRNEANKNIFEHKQFRRNCKEALKNIKRKGCNGKKTHNENQCPEKEEISEPEPIKSHKTVVNSKACVDGSQSYIPRRSPLSNPYCQNLYHFSRSNRSSPISNSPFRKKLIEQFLETLPEIVRNQSEIENILREMKKNPKYQPLYSKDDMKRIVKKIKKLKLPKPNENQLDDLSIQEEILVENVNGPVHHNPSLAIFSTEKCLPIRSLSLIGSLNFVDDVENLLYPH